jgi:hypothetical protein
MNVEDKMVNMNIIKIRKIFEICLEIYTIIYIAFKKMQFNLV